MVTHHNNTNPYNTFKSLKATEGNRRFLHSQNIMLTQLSEGNSMNLLTIQQEYHDKYESLTKEEKAEIVEEFNAQKEDGMKIRRPTARARIQDVANVSQNMQLLVGIVVVADDYPLLTEL
jgi:hypothetical protein